MASNSIRVSAELFTAAAAEGQVMSRSAAQQLEHWARLGRALEGTGLSVDDLKAVLIDGKELLLARMKAAGKLRQEAR